MKECEKLRHTLKRFEAQVPDRGCQVGGVSFGLGSQVRGLGRWWCKVPGGYQACGGVGSVEVYGGVKRAR